MSRHLSEDYRNIDDEEIEVIRDEAMAECLADNGKLGRAVLNFEAESLQLLKDISDRLDQVGGLLTMIFKDEMDAYLDEIRE